MKTLSDRILSAGVGITIFKNETHGWMVSLKHEEGGLRVHYGPDLEETLDRALDGGSQMPPEPDWMELI